MTEKEIVEQIIKGDKELFTQLILKYKMLLYKITLTRLSNQEDINDAIQETMIAAYRNIHKLKDPLKLKAWIIKILINKCNAIYTKNKWKILSIHEIEEVNLEKKTDQIEDEFDMEIAIRKLESKEQQIIILYYYERYSTKEIGEILKINENTIKTRLRRSLIKLKDYYKEAEEVN